MASRARATADQRREHGSAMLEFVLVLPFLWLILALTLTFGAALAERQRSMVALRELALRHSATLASGRAAAIDAVAAAVNAEAFVSHGMSGLFTYLPDDGSCPRDGEGVSGSAALDALSVFQGALRDVSSSQSYLVTARGRSPVGHLLPPPQHVLCFAVDGAPWTYHETGGPLRWLSSKLDGLGVVVDAIF